MKDLQKSKCVPCNSQTPPVIAHEIDIFLRDVPEWKLVEEDGLQKLFRKYPTKKYASTIDLFNRIAQESQKEDHHPVMLAEYDALSVWWWSHKIKGLHRNDFVMASKSDACFERLKQ